MCRSTSRRIASLWASAVRRSTHSGRRAHVLSSKRWGPRVCPRKCFAVSLFMRINRCHTVCCPPNMAGVGPTELLSWPSEEELLKN
uniref:Uncharacterized protein n=1 Tax=Lutzomyia longipalpis TaxID=7200 RepID=A0A1B0GLM4_LUTLO